MNILYSFRRCPYAIRARLALSYALPEQSLELREVVLKDKPSELLAINPNATVPVLHLLNDDLSTCDVLSESLHIMLWALAQTDSDGWLEAAHKPLVLELIALNDGDFKWALDHYKYADRYDNPPEYYRKKAEVFLAKLEGMLKNNAYLFSANIGLADMAIAPFIRQFAHVDKDWFFNSQYVHLQQWLNIFLESQRFKSIMKKYPQWKIDSVGTYFP